MVIQPWNGPEHDPVSEVPSGAGSSFSTSSPRKRHTVPQKKQFQRCRGFFLKKAKGRPKEVGTLEGAPQNRETEESEREALRTWQPALQNFQPDLLKASAFPRDPEVQSSFVGWIF